MLIAAILSTLIAATSAVPSDTDPKAQLREASALADGMKVAVGEFIANNNRLPESNEEAGLPAPTLIRGRYVASGAISGPRIIFEFGPGADKSLVSRHVAYEAELHFEDGRFVSLMWRCKSEDIAQEVCPKSCVCTGSPVQ
jgi:type IV pilus assembly protein PilA